MYERSMRKLTGNFHFGARTPTGHKNLRSGKQPQVELYKTACQCVGT